LISAHTVAAEIDDGRLVTLDVVGLPIMREWYAVRRSTLRPSPAEVLFWSFLTENANGFLPHSFGTANPHPHG
ncbi:MAG: LysR substrate-binding domain-containing protein, partial [Actinomycetota bacterium]